MSPLQFYQAQAAQQTLAAEQASLVNVRERCQRAAQAWNALASRIERGDETRAEALASKLLEVSKSTMAGASATHPSLSGVR